MSSDTNQFEQHYKPTLGRAFRVHKRIINR
jgi:hypothetical protein